MINNKIYIGQHKKPQFDNKYLGSGYALRNAIQKYGKHNFKCELIECCNTLEELNTKEIYYIKKFKSQNKDIGYNITNGGNQISVTPIIADKISKSMKKLFMDKTKGKILRDNLSKVNKGKKLSKEHLDILKEVNHTRQRTEEERNKKSEKLKGHKPFWGVNLDDNIRYRIGSASRGKHWYNNGEVEKYSFECPDGFVIGRLPVKIETKQKLSEIGKKRVFSDETKQKLSKSKSGKNNPQYGKTGTIKGKIRVTNSKLNIIKYIYPNELELYLAKGFKK